ncbi:helix-turn-helix domain-containing protein [Microbacterium sp.]|uniref:helix-turn-helix domain-containing protein n=1 Tax=Microbacterium sp. TaxID=51671 RepID=UPI003A8B8C49
MILVASAADAESALRGGAFTCPGCAGRLRPYGHGRTRTVRGAGAARLTVTPRRARCASCRATHMLLPAALSVRMADTTEGIGAALAAKARGDGYRAIAARLGRPVSTVRRWLRRVRPAHARWLYEQGMLHLRRYDSHKLAYPGVLPTLLGQALNVLAGAALTSQHTLGSDLPPWTLIGIFARGHLLGPPLRT